VNDYIQDGLKLINIPIQKIIFIEEEIYNTYLKTYNNIYTTYIFIKKKDVYLYEYKDQILHFYINTANPTKDTLEYMFFQCNKTEWVKQAIDFNGNNEEQYIWLDFGIYHIIRNETLFYDSLCNLEKKEYKKVRIAGGNVYDRDIYEDDYIYKNVSWKLLGGIFGGDKDSLLLLAELTKNKCIETIQTKQTLPWEVNIWHMIHKENPELFDIYIADHNISMINTY
jgi:hypothetical protein